MGVVGTVPPFPVIDRDRMPGGGSPDLAMEEIPETLGFGIPGVGSCDIVVSVCGLVQGGSTTSPLRNISDAVGGAVCIRSRVTTVWKTIFESLCARFSFKSRFLVWLPVS